jgi:hypothetical protein
MVNYRRLNVQHTPAVDPATAPQLTQAVTGGGGETILLVEDDDEGLVGPLPGSSGGV